MTHDDVLKFWFEELSPRDWFIADPAQDERIRQRFGALLAQAGQAELHAWRSHAEGRLAEIIVLDQFSRNIHRDSPRAFAQDPMALVLAQEAVARDALHSLTQSQCSFLLMPYMHSESAAVHEQAEALFRDFASKNSYGFEVKHRKIVDRFGRYPHRNSILGRESSAEEIEFLKQPGSSF